MYLQISRIFFTKHDYIRPSYFSFPNWKLNIAIQ